MEGVLLQKSLLPRLKELEQELPWKWCKSSIVEQRSRMGRQLVTDVLKKPPEVLEPPERVFQSKPQVEMVVRPDRQAPQVMKAVMIW